MVAQNEGRYAEAESYNRETLKLMEALPNFPTNERARQMSNLASVLNLLGRPDEGMKLLFQAEHLLNEYPSEDPGPSIRSTAGCCNPTSRLKYARARS
jgi:hypothetical protein